MRRVERVGAVVVLGIDGESAGAGDLGCRKCVGRLRPRSVLRGGRKAVRACHVQHDQHFEALLGDIGGGIGS